MSMPQTVEQLLVANYLSLQKAYLDDVIVPSIEILQRAKRPIEKCYRIGGKTVVVRFYAESLAKYMTRAFVHTEIERPPFIDLCVHAWDSVSTGVELAMPWTREQYYSEGSQHTTTSTQVGVFTPGEDTITVYDRETHTAFFWIRDGACTPSWIVAAPLRTLLHWFLGESGIQLIHGAVIGYEDRALLLTAKGGSGKSSTALACVRAGMTYLGDDYVGIEERETEVRAHSLYQSLKVAPPGGEKQVFFVDALAPDQIRQEARLIAICIPVIRHTRTTTFLPAHKAQALLALAPTTLLQLPQPDAHRFAALRRIVEKTPCHVLELSEDPEEIASVMKAFLENHV